ncbi:hypothetical protein AN958_01437 [Leucoagaricus sp. SymC.cos]|nr:hypothetical protein AN958_01437 [Leucoagaricus sp. SymC.cos]
MSAHDVIMQFFEEQDADNQKKLAKEMLVEWQHQESCDRFPPIRSAPVYVWEYNSNAPGFISQREVDINDCEPTLTHYHDQVRIYDPFVNEWNCYESELFNDDHITQAGDGEGIECFCNSEHLPVQNVKATFTTSTPSPISFLETVIDDPYKLDDTMLELSWLQYGFVPPLPLPDQYQGPGGQTTVDLRAALAITGIPVLSPEADAMKTTIPQLCIDFLQYFWRTPPVKPPVDHWDIHPSSYASLAGVSRIEKIRILKSSNKENVYMFDLGNSLMMPWKLAVHSASIALLICHLPESLSPLELAHYLLEKGIRFRTLRL